jgi:flavin reductase (DIM6/NTAB) family NADH-FMN oxidoreductase RutF
LAVVTTVAADGERSGCLAGFLTQCSIEPPRFLVCLSKANHTLGVAARARGLGVHLLGTDQAATASLFGEPTGDEVDKFAEVGWHPGILGVPVLDDCSAWMEVRIIERFDAGDHVALLTLPVVGGAGRRSGVMTNRDAPPLEAGHPAG